MGKELRELLTPATVIPIVLMALILGSLGNAFGGIESELNEKPVVGVINEDNNSFSNVVTSILDVESKVVFSSTNITDKQEGLRKLFQEEGVALIVIPKNFTQNIETGRVGNLRVYWIMRGAGIMDSIPSNVVSNILSLINTNISQRLIQNNASVNATIALHPTVRNETTYFKGKELVGVSPDRVISVLSSQSTFIPIVMMMIIITAGGMVISSMALEKENKTLETLLTLPVKRTSIVAGKIIASALVGLLLATIYMLGLSFYMRSFQFSGGVNLATYGLMLTPQELFLVGVSLFVTLISALSLCMLLGVFARNYKSAQTLTFPITMLALIPMFITMFKDFGTLPFALKILVFAIPFSHPMMAPRALLFDEYLLVVAGILYVSFFALVTIVIAVQVFRTDRLVTGVTKKKRFFGRRR